MPIAHITVGRVRHAPFSKTEKRRIWSLICKQHGAGPRAQQRALTVRAKAFSAEGAARQGWRAWMWRQS